MKALKFGLTLMLGLSMGCGAQAFAQSSGQTAAVTPNNPNTLSEVPVAGEAVQDASQAEYQDALRPPMTVENLMGEGKFTEAVAELDKFVKSGQGDACYRMYVAYQTYTSLMNFDANQAAGYAQKRDALKAEMEKKCANSAVTYIMKAQQAGQTPGMVVTLMTKAMEIDPKLELCYELRGNALWQLGQSKEACADFAAGAKTGNPALSSLYNTYCRAFMTEEAPAAE